MARVLVAAEFEDGVLHDVSLQCVGAARALAGADGTVAAAAIGRGAAAVAPALLAAGAANVAIVDDDRLSAYVAEPYVAALQQVLRTYPAEAILLPATTLGNDLGPALAAAIGAACVTDADAVATENGRPVAARIGFDRKVRTVWTAASDRPLVATLRDGAAAAPAPVAAPTGTAAPFPIDWPAAAFATKVTRRDIARKTVNLRDAKIIVAAGAGVGGPEGLALVQELAAALGAELGGTRAVVDAGWMSADRQIGQTGATVRPDLYIACGISGAIQHRVGMMDSRTVIAINTDPNAPIFRSAHYRICGDLKAVIPKLLKLLKA